MTKDKRQQRIRRHVKVRTRISGTAARPRLSVFRSSKHIYAMLIDDVAGKTLLSANDVKGGKGTKIKRAEAVGADLAAAASTKKIKAVVFDRGGYLFTGRVKALADGARAGGLNF